METIQRYIIYWFVMGMAAVFRPALLKMAVDCGYVANFPHLKNRQLLEMFFDCE